jgi:membrane-bound lytic murein transglycosylase A
MRALAGLALALALGACAGAIPQGAGNVPATPKRVVLEPPAARPVPTTPLPPKAVTTLVKGPNARSAGLAAGPDIASLPISDSNAARAFAAFRASCPVLLRRADGSGLTQTVDWQSACQSATAVADQSPIDFFRTYFEAVQVGAGTAFATGYFIPEIRASRTATPGYATPIYKRPADEMDVDLGVFSDALKGKTIHGHVVQVPIATGTQARFLPYPERSEIARGALTDPALTLAYAQDAAAFFFLQVQGSGILRFPDGSKTRIGYAGQNGHDYTGIGSVMKAQNLFADGAYSYQNITNYLRAHPAEAQALMNSNKSFVFFRELPDAGIPGALGVPLTDRASVAADPQFIPLGAPVFLSMDRAEPNGLWIAQDTGGAIKGANRVDTYWGAGAAAQAIAGGMSARGTAFILLPKGALSRVLLSATQTPQP